MINVALKLEAVNHAELLLFGVTGGVNCMGEKAPALRLPKARPLSVKRLLNGTEKERSHGLIWRINATVRAPGRARDMDSWMFESLGPLILSFISSPFMCV